jgi:hypothetical protein
MRVIHRTQFHVADANLSLPAGAIRVLDVARQRTPGGAGWLEVWYETEDASLPWNIRLRVHATGDDLPEDRGRFVSTVVDGQYVWHVYVEGEVD